MERHDGVAGGLRQPDGPGLRLVAGPARPVHREGGRPARGHVARELQQRAPASARRRPPSLEVAEPPHDARDPLPVEILAGDRDHAAIAEVDGRRQDAPVPQREDRLSARRRDGFEMLGAVLAPPKGPPEERNQRVADGGDGPSLEALEARSPPVGVAHGPACSGGTWAPARGAPAGAGWMRPSTNVIRSTTCVAALALA